MQSALLLSVAAPTVLAVVLLALGLRPWRADVQSRGRWALAIVVPLGALAAYIAVRGAPAFPPTDAGVWPLWCAFAAAAYALAAAALPLTARIGARVVLAAVTVWLVSKPRIDHTWDAGTTALWIVGATVAIALVWTALEHRAEKLSGSALPVALTVWGTGAATVLGLSGSALLAQTAGGATAAIGVAAAIGVWRQSLSVARSLVGPAVVLVGGLVLAGMHYAEVDAVSAALVVAGALVIGFVSVPAFASAGLKATAGLAGVMIVTSGAAIASSAWPTSVEDTPTGRDSATDTANDSDDDYGYE